MHVCTFLCVCVCVCVCVISGFFSIKKKIVMFLEIVCNYKKKIT